MLTTIAETETAAGRRVTVTADGRDGQRLGTRVYDEDALGRLTQAVDTSVSGSAVTTTFGWDSLGNRTLEGQSVVGAAGEVRHRYDGLGNAVKTQLAGTTVQRQFDGLRRLSALVLSAAVVPSFAAPDVKLQYVGLGGPTERRYASGVVTSYGYDGLGTLTSQVETRGTTRLAEWSWDAPGDGIPRRASLTRGGLPGNASLYEVDGQGRLMSEQGDLGSVGSLGLGPEDGWESANAASATAATSAPAAGWWRTYGLDGRDNWVEREGSEAGQTVTPGLDLTDGYETWGEDEVEVDDRGSLTRLGAERYGYNGFGELATAERGTVRRAYVRDALGRVVVERTLDASGAVVREVATGTDGAGRVVRRVGSGALEVTVEGPGLDEHYFTQVAGNGQSASGAKRHYLHQDRMGSVYLATDAAGSPAEWGEYTAYGELTLRGPKWEARSVSGLPLANRFGYQGQVHDVELGLVDMRARAYRPAWGRFLSQDPIGYAGGLNLYAFVGSAPLAYLDPLGLERKNPGKYVRADSGPQNDWVGNAGQDLGQFSIGCVEGVWGAAGTLRHPTEIPGQLWATGGMVWDAATGTWRNGIGTTLWRTDPDTFARGTGRLVGGTEAGLGMGWGAGKLVTKVAPMLPGALAKAGAWLNGGGKAGAGVESVEAGAGGGAAATAAGGATRAIGFADDAVASAYQGMRSGGGHAMRHLIDEGLIPNVGSLASRAQAFERLTSPILRSPAASFDWRLGGTAARAFAGEAGGRQVVVFVAKEGPYQGRVLSAIVPDASQIAQWGL